MAGGASADDDDQRHMAHALRLAERGWGRVAPNPLVGAVLVNEGAVVGEGWHREYGSAHAEVEAIRAAGTRTTGATLYVSLEPCAHHGQTPPCTAAILAAGIARVVYAAADPNPAAMGGAAVLQRAGLALTAGIHETAARSLNAPFFRAHQLSHPRRPWTELKLALSLDGRVADHTGRSAWITGEQARAEVHRLRAGNDAIAVGVGTVLADDPLLTPRGSVLPRKPPLRVIFDRKLRIPLTSRLVASAGEAPVRVYCSAAASAEARGALEARGVEVLEASDLAAAFHSLGETGVSSVFCEGGAALASALLADDLVDRLSLFYAPLLLGPGALEPFGGLPPSTLEGTRRWRLVRSANYGNDTLVSVER
jgi:diaminohydroxyphosphoribosylaminopyrimidine deaminase/5-amino-6-(5-phosphoribosylamino)uracil reductase